MFDNYNIPFLVDFGIARLLGNEGQIDDANYEQSYTFSGESGQAVTILVETPSGSVLDSVLRLQGPEGDLLIENDDRDSTTIDAEIPEFVLPADGVYTVTVTRFLRASGVSSGVSSGEFILTIELDQETGALQYYAAPR